MDREAWSFTDRVDDELAPSVSACATGMPSPVATAVPIPNATARVPILPTCALPVLEGLTPFMLHPLLTRRPSAGTAPMVGIFGSGHDLDLSINHAYASVARNAAEFDGITEIQRGPTRPGFRGTSTERGRGRPRSPHSGDKRPESIAAFLQGLRGERPTNVFAV